MTYFFVQLYLLLVLPIIILLSFSLLFSNLHCTKDSFSFCQEIKNVGARNNVLVSYDFCSLFTSIPLTETINIAVDLFFEKKTGFKMSNVKPKKVFPVCYFRFTFHV